MKKIALLFTAFILIFSGCEKTDDLTDQQMPDRQLKSGDNKTINSYFSPNAMDYFTPIICEGEVVDFLEGDGESLR